MPRPVDAPTLAPPPAPPVQPFVAEALPLARLDAGGCIAEEIACRSCGYALRGLPLNGACPECGTPVAKSIYGDLLRFCDPRWIERLARGAQVLVAALVTAVGGAILMVVVMAALAAMLTGSTGAAPGPWVFLAPVIVYGLIVGALQVLGCWLLTSRDPGSDESGKPINARVVARWCIVASAALSMLSLPLQQQVSGPVAAVANTPALLLALSLALTMAQGLANLAGYVALMLHARALALRIPDDRLAGQARTVMWGYAIAGAIALVGSVMVAAVQRQPGDPLMLVGLGISAVGGIVSFVFLIWAVVLLFIFKSRFRKAASEARMSWARMA
jgi:hypothetical protein